MILASESSGWKKFWEKVWDFLWIPDDGGLNYLTRILLAIGLIVLAWLLLKLISFFYKKTLNINKKKPLEIDASAKFFILNIIKIFYWLAIAFLVISTLKINVTGVAGIASAITVALGLAYKMLLHVLQQG